MQEGWNLHNTTYPEQEEFMTDFRGVLKEPRNRNFVVPIIISRALDPVTSSEDLVEQAESRGFIDMKLSSIKTANL